MIKFYRAGRRSIYLGLVVVLVLLFPVWRSVYLQSGYNKVVEIKLNQWSKQTRITVDFEDKDSAAAKALKELRDKKLKKDMQRNHDLWEINPELEGKLPLDVTIPEYYTDKSITTPPVQPFDPRFNIGVYLNYILMKTKNSKENEKLAIPFNWKDWIDTSILDKYALYQDKPTCNQIFSLPKKLSESDRRYINPDDYCKQESSSSHGFKVIRSPGLQFIKGSVIAGRSYLTNEMSAPHRVVFLGSSGRDSVQFGFEKSDKTIITNGVVQQLIKSGQVEGTIDVGKAFKEMESKFITPNKNELPYKRELKKDSFLVSPTTIISSWESSKQSKRDEPKEQKAASKDDSKKEDSKAGSEEQPKAGDAKAEKPKAGDAKAEKPKAGDAKAEKPKAEDTKAKSPNPASIKLSDPATLSQFFVDSLKGSIHHKDDPKKYFTETQLVDSERERKEDYHYDWRFFNGFSTATSEYEHENLIIHQLTRVWLKFTQSNDINTWLAHGSLLSWYWNGMVFPWDSDIDFQMSVEDLYKLAAGFNQSIIVENIFDQKGAFQGLGRYFLDVGSSITVREKKNGNNNIDARLIDIDTGFFLDITGLSISDSNTPDRYKKLQGKSDLSKLSNFERNKALNVYNCRNLHFSLFDEISPLILTTIDNLPVYVPSKYQAALEVEYESSSLIEENFSHYFYMSNFRMWVETQKALDYIASPKKYIKQFQKRVVGAVEKYRITRLGAKQHIDILQQNSLLIQYELGHTIAKNHEHEIKLLNAKDYEASEKFTRKNWKDNNKPLRKDLFSYKYFKDNWRWDRAVSALLELVVVYEGGEGRSEASKPQQLKYTKGFAPT
ncbi:hypothetical protein CLIB1423_02S10748 [[Candida] railenensis]|uniref:LicD/FKTN/FKRP nucleotidyltransferase domain-containing protein n=1 Tax=[Candida] railenensis TaxID=45579 RepID=A0A9P0VX41_9ASCO|nr:hypothetical protein CLIB1423_02S10748 [[Candida] railenensis]